ncbi:hypothetical protein AaE_008983 [Aphanomyces astaci]|uniref:RCC1-like domain-containing protein n=1 Tax=Aphanomyces astaci TaxID=112090 RepID=A0A6A5A663_APHAT|nr:hypothetical protein AaE_008983 [Aphanomyces astaci]
MKHTLRSLPVLGTGMSMLDFLFLRRDIKVDRVTIQAYMQSFVQDNFPFWLVLFPEGTTIFTESVLKSHEFATAQHRPVLHRVMLPRSTGLKLMLDAFKDSPVQPTILDVTMAFPSYSGEVPTYEMGYDRHVDVDLPSMKKLLMGHGPSKVHFHCRHFSMADVGDDVQAFLDALWVDKEALLNEFIQHQVGIVVSRDRLFEFERRALSPSNTRRVYSGPRRRGKRWDACGSPGGGPFASGRCYFHATYWAPWFEVLLAVPRSCHSRWRLISAHKDVQSACSDCIVSISDVGATSPCSKALTTCTFALRWMDTMVQLLTTPTWTCSLYATTRCFIEYFTPLKQHVGISYLPLIRLHFGRLASSRCQPSAKAVAPPRSSTSSSVSREPSLPPPPIVKVSVRNLRLRRGGNITYNLKMATCLMSRQEVVVSVVLPESVHGISVSPSEVLFTRSNFRQPQAIAVHATDTTDLLRFSIQHIPTLTWLLGPDQEAATVAPVVVQVMPKQALFVFCFGSGLYGRLGVTHPFDKRDASACTPTPLGTKWLVPAQVACGKAHTAIIDANAHLYCFGRGSEGQLGQPHVDHVKAASVVPKLMNMLVTHVSCGANHTLCIVNNMWAYAWGDNSSGQLGLNLKAKHHRTPSRIHHLPDVRSVVCAGDHSFALMASGDVFATGSNIAGQLGFGDTTTRATFTQNPHLTHVHHLASGMYHAIAHTKAPLAVVVWGCGGNGRLGLGDVESRTTPADLTDFRGTRVLQVAAGGTHSALLTEAGDLLMWGGNAYGQVGDGLYSDRLVPHRLRMFQGKFVRAISLGEWHSVALVDDACVYAWGFGEEGQLGLGDDRSSSLPLVVNPLSGTAPVSVCCGGAHTVVVTTLETSCRTQQEKDRQVPNILFRMCRHPRTSAADVAQVHAVERQTSESEARRRHEPTAAARPTHNIVAGHPLEASTGQDAKSTPDRAAISRHRQANSRRRIHESSDEPRRAVEGASADIKNVASNGVAVEFTPPRYLRQLNNIGLLKPVSTPSCANSASTRVSAALVAQEAAMKTKTMLAQVDPFDTSLLLACKHDPPSRPKASQPPRNIVQRRPQTAPSRQYYGHPPPSERATPLHHDDSLSALLDNDDDDDRDIDHVLSQEMHWID